MKSSSVRAVDEPDEPRESKAPDEPRESKAPDESHEPDLEETEPAGEVVGRALPWTLFVLALVAALTFAWLWHRAGATDRADGEALTAADVQDRLPRRLAPLDIVLVRTGRDAFYDQPDYMARGPGVTAGATRWLYEQGVRVMGIDAWGWDAPLHIQAQEAVASGQPGVFWAAHQADLPYSQIERLCNLGALPPHGFTVCCFPLKIVGGSAAPARVVAIL